MDSLNSLLDTMNLHCPKDEYDNLKKLFDDINYNINNNVDLSLELYNKSIEKINYLYSKINLEKSYNDNSALNYKLNILRRLFIEFFSTSEYDKQILLIHAIFSSIIFIIDNYS
jgi:hypothetical protein